MEMSFEQLLESERLLNSREMAKLLGVELETFQRWLRDNDPALEGLPEALEFGKRTRRWSFPEIREWFKTVARHSSALRAARRQARAQRKAKAKTKAKAKASKPRRSKPASAPSSDSRRQEAQPA